MGDEEYAEVLPILPMKRGEEGRYLVRVNILQETSYEALMIWQDLIFARAANLDLRVFTEKTMHGRLIRWLPKREGL